MIYMDQGSMTPTLSSEAVMADSSTVSSSSAVDLAFSFSM